MKKIFLNWFKSSYTSLKIISLIPWVKQNNFINRFLSQLNGFWGTLLNLLHIFLDKSNSNTRTNHLVKSNLLFYNRKLVYHVSFYQLVNGSLPHHRFFAWTSLYYTNYCKAGLILNIFYSFCVNCSLLAFSFEYDTFRRYLLWGNLVALLWFN